MAQGTIDSDRNKPPDTGIPIPISGYLTDSISGYVYHFWNKNKIVIPENKQVQYELQNHTIKAMDGLEEDLIEIAILI